MKKEAGAGEGTTGQAVFENRNTILVLLHGSAVFENCTTVML